MFIRRPRLARPHGQAAFTFAEILAAMAFMAILMPVVMRGLMIANRAAVAAERRADATRLGSNLLNELIVTDQWQDATRSGNFGDQWPGFEWTLQENAWDADTMTELSVIVSYPAQGQEHWIRLTTLIDDSVEEAAE